MQTLDLFQTHQEKTESILYHLILYAPCLSVTKLSPTAVLLHVHQHIQPCSLEWTRLCSPVSSSCRSAHLLAVSLLSLSVSLPCLPPELLSSFLISSDLGGGREWGEARLYPNPLWITAACGAQSWATKTPTADPVLRVGEMGQMHL